MMPGLKRLPARQWVCYNSPKHHSSEADGRDQPISVNPDFNIPVPYGHQAPETL